MRLIVLALLLVASACSSAEVASDPDSRDFGAVRSVIAAQEDDLSRGDRTAFAATLDPTRSSLSRCELDTFDTYRSVGMTARRQVLRLDRYRGYVRAYLSADLLGGYRPYFFVQDKGVWRQTEPGGTELGEHRSKTVGAATLDYWEIDEDIASSLVASADDARAKAAQFISRTDPTPFLLHLYPIRYLISTEPCWSAGWASINEPAHPEIALFSPSVGPDLRTLSVAAIGILRHEALHWAQGQELRGSLFGLDWWTVEGWADVRAGIDRVASFRAACLTSAVPAADRMLRHDPFSDPPPSLQAEYEYASANLMVRFLLQRYGEATYWRLVSMMKQLISNDRAYAEVLGLTPSQFYDSWRAQADC
jgi:hypothetical protein